MESALIKEEYCKNGFLSATAIKYFAAAAMLIDHIGWIFIDYDSTLGQCMHFIGRFAAPLMCYFAAEGFYLTHDIKKYLQRLAIFAALSHFPFVIFEFLDMPPIYRSGKDVILNTEVFYPKTGVIFTIFLGVALLTIWKSDKFSKSLKYASLVFILCFSIFGDWMFFGVLWIFCFGIYRGNIKKQLACYYVIGIASIAYVAITSFSDGKNLCELFWQLGVLFAPLPILVYNGKRGGIGQGFSKWFFYLFYPAHLLIIGLIKVYT